MDQYLSDHMEQAAVERAARYQLSMIERWPALTGFDEYVFCGSYSWTLPNTKRRMLYGPSAVNIGFGPQTPGDVIRDYLDFKYPKRLRATAAQRESLMVHRSFPALANRVNLDDAAYIDIKSAYWSIILACGWNVDYYPGRWLGVSSDNHDFPLQDNKPARSGLVTAGLSTPIRYWDGHGLHWKNGNNTHINYGLWALVMDVLHAIAAEVVKAGAVYVHTDGYIVPHQAIDRTMNIITDWGLTASLRDRGETKVYGVGMYSIGNTRTKRLGGFLPGGFRNIEPHDPDFLKPRFAQFARSRL